MAGSKNVTALTTKKKSGETFSKTLLATIGAGALAAVTYWFAPLKDIVLHRIYSEQAEIFVVLDRQEIGRGQSVKVDVRVTQKSVFPISPGEVEIVIDSTKLNPVPGHALRRSTKEIAGVVSVSEDKPLLLTLADGGAGEASVSAKLFTKYGTYVSNPVIVRLKPESVVVQPYLEQHASGAINLSGEWRLEVSAIAGKMSIKQLPTADVNGVFELGTGTERKAGKINGFKDGTTFRVFFDVDSPNSEKWRVEANFAINPDDRRFIEIKGCAYSIVKDSSVEEESGSPYVPSCQSKRNYVGWRGVASNPFYAVAQLRN